MPLEGISPDDSRNVRAGSLTRASKYIKQVTEALAYCHSMKVSHRDIHPGNLLINMKGDSWFLLNPASL